MALGIPASACGVTHEIGAPEPAREQPEHQQSTTQEPREAVGAPAATTVPIERGLTAGSLLVRRSSADDAVGFVGGTTLIFTERLRAKPGPGVPTQLHGPPAFAYVDDVWCLVGRSGRYGSVAFTHIGGHALEQLRKAAVVPDVPALLQQCRRSACRASSVAAARAVLPVEKQRNAAAASGARARGPGLMGTRGCRRLQLGA